MTLKRKITILLLAIALVLGDSIFRSGKLVGGGQ